MLKEICPSTGEARGPFLQAQVASGVRSLASPQGRRRLSFAVGAACMARKSPSEKRRMQALADGLRGMFRALEQRPTPDHLTSVVEQLEGSEAPPNPKARRG